MASTARLDELKKKFDENPRRYFAPLANEHRKSGDLDQAIALCRTHLPQQPGHISGHIVLAQALYEAGGLDESREIFHTALGLDPENLIALRYLGDIAKDSSDIETARTWYQRVLEVDPRNDEIADLIRALDEPQPAAAEEPPEVEDEQSTFAPPVAAAVEPAAAPSNNDARFAPLSVDEIDIDDAVSPASSDDAHAVTAGPTDAPLETLESAGIDPFDLDPAGSVEALLDGNEVPAEDFFLTELATDRAPQDVPDAGAHVAGSEASSDVATPQAQTGETVEFEEGDFYLEPPPAPPAESHVEEAAPVAAAREPEIPEIPEVIEASSTPGHSPNESTADAMAAGMDAFAAEYYAPADHASSERAAEYAAEPLPSIDELEPNAEPVASHSEEPAEAWEPAVPDSPVQASASPSDVLGLEVMEFVPPSSEPEPTASAPADPASSEQRVAPAAFVTETMAELYLQQGFRNEALEVYRELLSRNPADAGLRERIQQIESGSIASVGMAMVSEDVVESARKRQTARPARSVRSFFASLASRRAPVHDAAPDAPQAIADDREAHEPEGIAESYAEPEAVRVPEREATPETPAFPEPVAEQTEPSRPDPITPLMSAAETLASFDPFADTTESTASDPWGGPPPNDTLAPPIEPPAAAMATELPPPPRAPTPIAPPAITPESAARRSLEDLFPDTPVTARTEVAAETLATAFGRSEPQGRPTRAASNELSLDHVFRGAPEGPPPGDGGFSFDQFFSDSHAPGVDTSTTSASSSDSGRGASGDTHDIEQFTAWLEGLKKK